MKTYKYFTELKEEFPIEKVLEMIKIKGFTEVKREGKYLLMNKSFQDNQKLIVDIEKGLFIMKPSKKTGDQFDLLSKAFAIDKKVSWAWVNILLGYRPIMSSDVEKQVDHLLEEIPANITNITKESSENLDDDESKKLLERSIKAYERLDNGADYLMELYPERQLQFSGYIQNVIKEISEFERLIESEDININAFKNLSETTEKLENFLTKHDI